MSEDTLNILVKAKVDNSKKAIDLLDSQIKNLSGKIKSAITVKLNIDAKDIAVVSKQIEDVNRKLKTKYITKSSMFINPKVEQQAFDDIKKRAEEVKKSVDSLAKVKIFKDDKNQLNSAIITYKNELGQIVQETMAWSTALKKVNDETIRIKTFKTKGTTYTDDLEKLQNLQKQTEKLQFNLGEKLSNVKFTGFKNSDWATYAKEAYGANAEVSKLGAVVQTTLGKVQAGTIKVKTGASTYDEYKLKISEATQSVHQFGQAIEQNVSAKDLGFTGLFKVAMERFPVWMAASTVFYQTIGAIKDGIQYIVDMDNAMVELGKVTELTASQMDAMRLSAIEMGKALGQSSVDVMSGMAEFGRYYKNMADIQEMTKVAVMASNVTSLSVAEASKALTSTMITYKLSVEDAMGVLDQFNEIQNNFRTNAEDLANAIGKMGASAQQSGTKIQDLEGYITAVVAATGTSGDEVGTFLKSAISRIYRIGAEGAEDAGKAEEYLDTLDVKVRKNGKEFRTFSEILTDVNKKWATLSNVEQTAVAQAIGGTHHYSKFMALMNNFQMATDATNTALNSQGSAIKENEKYINSITGRWETLKTSLQGVWGGFIDSNVIKELISGLTFLVDAFANLEVTLGTLISAFLIWKGTAILDSINSLFIFINTTNTANLALQGMLVSVQGLTFSLNALKLAWATNPLGLLAIAVTTVAIAFHTATTASKKFHDEQQKDITNSINQVNSLRQQKSDLEKLASEYELLKNAENATAEQKKRLLEIQEELVSKYGVTINGINAEGKAYSDSTKLINMRIAALEAETKAKQEALKIKLGSEDEGTTETLSDLNKQKQTAENAIKSWSNPVEKTGNKRIDNQQLQTQKEQLDKWSTELANINKKILDESKLRQQYLLADANNTIKTLETSGIKVSDSSKAFINEVAKGLSTQGIGFEEQQKQLTNFINEISSSDFDELANRYNELQQAITGGDNSSSNQEELNSISIELQGLVNQYIKANPYLKEYADLFLAQYPPVIKAGEAIDKYKTSIQNMASVFDTSSVNIKKYQELLNSLDKDGLTYETIAKISKDYPQFIEYLDDEVSLRQAINREIDTNVDSMKKAYRAAMMESTNFFNKHVKNNNDFINLMKNNYQIDLKNYTTLAKAKADVDAKLIKLLATEWKNYFSTSLDSISQITGMGDSDYRHLKASATGKDAFGNVINDGKANNDAQKVLSQVSLYKNTISRLDSLINADFDTSIGKSLDTSPSGSKKDAAEKELYESKIYEKALENVNRKLNDVNNIKSKLLTTSQEYRDNLQQEVNLLKEKQLLAHQEADSLRAKKTSKLSEINSIAGTVDWYALDDKKKEELFNKLYNANDNKKQTDFNNLLKDVDSLDKSISDLSNSWWDWENNINTNNFEIITSQVSAFDINVQELTSTLDILKTQQKFVKQGTDEYNKNVADQIAITNQINAKLKEKEALIEKEITNDKLSAVEKDNLNTALKETKKAIDDLVVSYKDELSALADEVIDIYKEVYEKQKDIALKAIEDEIDIEKERHDKVKENLDDELSQYEELIDARMELIDKAEDETTYQRKLADLQKERQDIQKKISAKSLNNSPEAQAELYDLNKQLTEKNNEITDLQHEHSVDAIKDSLNNLKKSYQKDIENQKDAEDKKYDKTINRLEKEKEVTENYWNDIINDEERFVDIYNDIMSGSLDNIENDFKKFRKYINGHLEDIGDNISDNLIDKMRDTLDEIENTRDAIDELKDYSSDDRVQVNSKGDLVIKGSKSELNLGTAYTSAEGGSFDVGKYAVDVYDKDGYVQTYLIDDPDNREWSMNELQADKETINDIVWYKGQWEIANDEGDEDKMDYIDEKVADLYDSLHDSDFEKILKGMNYNKANDFYNNYVKKLHTGGIVGQDTGTSGSPSAVTKLVNKLLNTTGDEQVIKALLNEVYTPEDNITRYFLPNMQRALGQVNPKVSLAGGNKYYLTVEVENMVANNKKQIEDTFTVIYNGLKKIGI